MRSVYAGKEGSEVPWTDDWRAALGCQRPIRTAHWRPVEMPAGGHENCPLCVAELDGEIAGLGFLDVIDGMGQPGMPERTQGVIGYMLELDLAGRGHGTDLARGLLSAAFDSLELRRVIAS